jgi:Ca-activated chloride channel family protein
MFRAFAASHQIALWPLLISGLLLSASATRADAPMKLEARLAQPVMKDGEKQQNYLRIALNGCKPNRTDRTPVNVAFVIDRSGSMQGPRIAQAREAAIMAINRLDQNDIASVVIFDDKIDVLVPARTVTDPTEFTGPIRQVAARGSTAIFAGVTEGANEVRKHKDPRRLNRVVLLSDGLANVGPRLPAEFARLGRDLLAEGISVSTIGLGHDYNEDLMQQLARASDGNHAFASAPTDLVQIFNKEFDDVLTSCAQTVSIDVDLKPGVRVVRALSRDGKIEDGKAQFQLNQVYAATEHYVLLELEFDGKAAGDAQDFGRVHVAYTVPETGAKAAIDAEIGGRFSASKDEIVAALDQAVLESVVEQSTRERTQQAIALRDQGKHEEAAKLFRENVAEIQAYQAKVGKPSAALQQLEGQYYGFAGSVAASPPAEWNVQRKVLRALDAQSLAPGVRY